MKKVLAALLVIAAVVIIWRVTLPKAPAEVVQSELPDLAEDVAIYVRNQEPGTQVDGEVAVLSSAGFAVVHGDNDGSIGEVIGTSGLLAAGRQENFVMTLDAPSENGEVMYAMLYTDTNANGTFDDGVDMPMRDSADNRVYMIFHASKSLIAP